MPGVFLLSPGPVFADPNQQAVQSNATVTVSGATIFTGYGASEVSLFINVKAAPTGTLPTLQYTIQEVDPGDGLTVIGPTVSSTVISAIGIERITMESAFGGSIKVSWVVTGTLPSFTQVYATLVAKQASVKITDGTDTVEVSASGALSTASTAIGTIGAAVPSTAEQVAGRDGSGNLRAPKIDAGGTQYHAITSPNAAAAGLTAFVSPYGTLRTSTEAGALFTDAFDGTVVDTTNRWNAVRVGTANVTQGNSLLTLTTGTTANNGVSLASQPVFPPLGTSFLLFGMVKQLDAVALTNAHHFWGFGTAPTVWAAATPLQDAVGFEQDTTGALNAVYYANGVRTIVAVLSRPSDGALHRYACVVRSDLVFWYLDSVEVPVASASFPALGQQSLPVRLHVINGAVGPSSGPIDASMALAVSDTGNNSFAISDGTAPWRKALVTTAGELQTSLADISESIKSNLRPLNRVLGMAVDPSTGRLRAAIDINAAQTLATVTTVTTVTTVAAVTSLNQLAGFDAKSTLLYSGERTMWAENVRSRIS